ncbi:MAG TPA: DUF4397 domain-containing protein [Flavihumibacter sp.]
MITIKRWRVLLFGSLLTAGCLKQEDKTGEGPKAGILVVNAAIDAAPVNILFDGQPIAPADLAFGEYSFEEENGYLRVKPGIRTIGWKFGSQMHSDDKYISWDPGAYYTLLHYDTALNGAGSWLILKDQPQSTDSSARVRFINCVAGKDSLTLWLINSSDTLSVASKRAFIEYTGPVNTEFNLNVVAGEWRYELLDRELNILDAAPLAIAPAGSYSFVGIGETGSTGEKQPRLLSIRQVK